MSKKFVVGVANVTALNISTGDVIFKSKTMLDDSITISTSNQEVSGGQGNALQYVYYHSGRLNAKLTDIQFSLNAIAANVGSTIVTGSDVWVEETVILGSGGTGSVVGTPILTPDISGSDVYGYVTDADGLTTKVTFSTKSFTLSGGAENDVVTVQYFADDASARYVKVNANFLPSIVRLILDAQLASSEESSAAGASVIGNVQIEIPRFQIAGSQEISMTSSGVSQTPLEGMALAYNTTAANSGYYATITEIIDSANWYDNVFALATEDNSIAITHPGTSTPVIWAIPNNGDAPFRAPVADLSFTSGTTATCTVGLHTGIITSEGSGTSVVSCVITSKNTVTLEINVTVS
jgi:hypothetical protein